MSDEKIAKTIRCVNCGDVIRASWRVDWDNPHYVIGGLLVDETSEDAKCCDGSNRMYVTDERIDDTMIIWNEEPE